LPLGFRVSGLLAAKRTKSPIKILERAKRAYIIYEWGLRSSPHEFPRAHGRAGVSNGMRM
jgi:hypothetical protein